MHQPAVPLVRVPPARFEFEVAALDRAGEGLGRALYAVAARLLVAPQVFGEGETLVACRAAVGPDVVTLVFSRFRVKKETSVSTAIEYGARWSNERTLKLIFRRSIYHILYKLVFSRRKMLLETPEVMPAETRSPSWRLDDCYGPA